MQPKPCFAVEEFLRCSYIDLAAFSKVKWKIVELISVKHRYAKPLRLGAGLVCKEPVWAKIKARSNAFV